MPWVVLSGAARLGVSCARQMYVYYASLMCGGLCLPACLMAWIYVAEDGPVWFLAGAVRGDGVYPSSVRGGRRDV